VAEAEGDSGGVGREGGPHEKEVHLFKTINLKNITQKREKNNSSKIKNKRYIRMILYNQCQTYKLCLRVNVMEIHKNEQAFVQYFLYKP